MKYPKEYLEEIKLRLKVSKVVGKTVNLKKRGKEFIGLSPFKNEKSPSFTVSDEKEFYHCFSSGEHGNIFDFIMKTKSIRFGEAVKILAAEAGMPQFKFSNFDEKKEKKFQVYKNIYKDYVNFFHNDLFNSNDQTPMGYLKKRGLEKKIIQEFQLGFVPWKNNFYETLLNNYSEEEISSTGLYYKNDKTGKFVDRFNSRIIFPIRNLSGDVIAFGGRIIRDSKLAKYINSPETEFYKKGRMLFNLDKAKSMRSMTDQIIIVEGYMDVVSLYSSGIKNVISNSGTALTESQIELIWKFFSNAILCLDGDESGQKAATRIAERVFPLINDNNKIYFSMLPDGLDPDDYIKKYGQEKFKNFLKEKKIIQSYVWDIYSNHINRKDPYSISKFEKSIKSLCYSIKDSTIKKYILEDFLDRIKNLTPNQNFKSNVYPYKKSNKNKNYKILSETKNLYNQKNQLTKEQIKEFSILFMLINYPSAAQTKIEEISEIKMSSNEKEDLKIQILNLLSTKKDQEIKSKLDAKFSNLIIDIEKYFSFKNVINKKNEDEKKEFLEELIQDLYDMNQLKKIEFLERKLTKNMDENSYSELVKLKSQLNRD